VFFTRPISALFLAAAVLSVIFSIRSIWKAYKKDNGQKGAVV
jgi:putative tricarboxylic transport membrane protein